MLALRVPLPRALPPSGGVTLRIDNSSAALALGALASLTVLAALYDGRWAEVAGAAAMAVLVSLGFFKPVADAKAAFGPKDGEE